MHTKNFQWHRLLILIALTLWGFQSASSQGTMRFLKVGSFQNWYSEYGCEVEEGRVTRQQDGWRWPAQYDRQDCQAAKGFWIGAKNFTNAMGVTYDYSVVHVGPRMQGDGDFFPMKFYTSSRIPLPNVYVDGNPSQKDPQEIAEIDPTLKADQVMTTEVNTGLGITMIRKGYTWGQQYHDNYHILEFTFVNTGRVKSDTLKALNKKLQDVYFFWQDRLSICQEIRYVVNNSAGWGVNTMNDMRGFPPDKANLKIPASENELRAAFIWHGLHPTPNKPSSSWGPNAGTFDNIGAPIFDPSLSAGYVPLTDTTSRFGATQCVGTVHIRASKSTTDHTDDPNQPSTTTFVDSNEPMTYNNRQGDGPANKAEYERMTEGHHSPRHAWLVEPDGNFTAPKNNPATVALLPTITGAGISYAYGYGPYQMDIGDTVKIVFAEAADGLTREEAINYGQDYKWGRINTLRKNVLAIDTTRARLLRTMRRAIANYDCGMNIPQPPDPPATFNVDGMANRIRLSWAGGTDESKSNFSGYRVFRAMNRPDSTMRLVFQCGGTAPTNPAVVYSASIVHSFDDEGVTRAKDYYYCVTAFGTPTTNVGNGLTPTGELESSQFFTRSYIPTNLKRAPLPTNDSIRIVPNPYVIAANQNTLLYTSRLNLDKIAFLNIPGNCSIKIYTELGELVKEIDHTNGSGDDYWYSVTSSNQVIVSGVYLVVIQDRVKGQKIIKKLVIVR